MKYQLQNCSDLYKIFMVNFTPLGFWEHLMNNYCNCLLLCIYRKPLYNQKQWGCPESSCGTEKSSMFPRNWCTAFPPASKLCADNISRWEINTLKRNTDLTKGNLLQIWIYVQRKCPRGYTMEGVRAPTCRINKASSTIRRTGYLTRSQNGNHLPASKQTRWDLEDCVTFLKW